MNRIAEKAAALGLVATAQALAAANINPDAAPREARLSEPAAGDIKSILCQMARRGSDPTLFDALWAKLENRPLERALVAVDVLASALWSPQDPRLGELRAAAVNLGPACPPAGEHGVNLTLYPAHQLIEKFASTVSVRSTVELLALAYQLDLTALHQLLQRDDAVLKRRATRDSILAFAQLARLARLPTLASVYLDWLNRSVGWQPASLELCETMFDAGVAHKIPGTTVQHGDVRQAPAERDLAEYLHYRSHLSVGDTDTALALMLDHTAQRERWVEPSLHIDVVRAHLGILYGFNNVALARIELACDQHPLWRYGAQVRAIMAAKHAPQRALAMFLAYLSNFGNDFESSRLVISLCPEDVKRDVARIICREAFCLPHEPTPWKLLGLLFGFGTIVAAEIDARLVQQSSP